MHTSDSSFGLAAIGLALACVLASPMAHASGTMYRCVEANGSRTYQQHPCSGKQSVNTRNSPSKAVSIEQVQADPATVDASPHAAPRASDRPARPQPEKTR